MKEEWKDILQDSLADFEEAAPEGLWQNIDKELSANIVISGEANDRKPGRHKDRLITVLACAACIACVIGFFIYKGNDDVKSISDWAGRKQNTALANEKKLLADNKSVKPSVSAPEDKETVAPKERIKDIMLSSTSGAQTIVDDAENTSEEKHAEAIEHDAGAEKKSVVINKPYASDAYTSAKSGKKKELFDKYDRKTYQGKWSASLFAANSMSNGGSATGMQLLSSSVSSDAMLGAVLQEKDNRVSGYYVKSSNDERVEHHHPVRVGLSVRYSLTKRLGVETGVTYSYLSSDISQGEESNCNKTEQKLHFVGVPLNVDYSLWNNKILNVYVSGGGMVEKNIKGNSTATYVLNGKTQSATDYKIKMNRLQWSVNAAAGVQVNFTKELGLYAEPGIGYYFDNGSALKTYYSEKPLSFNIKLGLRYTINDK